MPSYKLTYFNGRGRAESSRLMFALAGVSYEDIRMEREQWAEYKPKSKMGQLPELEVDGKKFTQSRAIMMYLGREFGFYPSNNEDALKVDEVIFIMEDFFSQAIKAHFAKPEEKEEKQKEYKEVQMPKFHGMLEKVLKENGTGYFVGNKITIADVAVFDFLSNHKEVLGDMPLLKALVDKVGNIDKIKAWVEKRPVTQM